MSLLPLDERYIAPLGVVENHQFRFKSTSTARGRRVTFQTTNAVTICCYSRYTNFPTTPTLALSLQYTGGVHSFWAISRERGMMKKYLASLAVLSLLMLGLTPANTQGQAPPPPPGSSTQQDDSTASSDAAAPGVARVSFLHGDVSSQRGDNSEWVALTQNSPVSQGDRVATGQNGRAELQLDFANILRMSGSATANLTNLSRTGIQVQVGQGLVTYVVLKGSEANAEIDTPNSSIRPQGPGEYRVLVNSDAETKVIVREGSADVSTPDGSTHVDQGEMITVAGTDNPQYKTEAAPGRDDWDTWNDDRDHRITGASSWGKTDRYYTGSEDLDTYGTWSEVPDYGPVWIPSGTDPNWAPYRAGRWVYQPYYGWTWVSSEPWGWAPYHYGRWFVYGNRWAWWPGPVVGYPAYYPVWSPAYVSFFGFGGGGFGFGVGFGFGFGSFGWLPCGPGDWFHPWYGHYGGRYGAVGIADVNNFHNGFGPLGGNRARQFSNVHAAMSSDRVRSGVSSMAGNQFGRGAVSSHQATISAASFRQGSMMTGRMPVTPSRESYSPSGRSANPSTIRSASSISQHFFSGGSRSNSSTAGASGSRSFGNSNASRGQSGFGGNSGSTAQSTHQGWQHFSTPQSGATNHSGQGFGANNSATVNNSSRGSFASPSHESNTGSQTENRGSWQHFTPPTTSSRGGSSNSYNSYSRPPLNMRQPIVTPRGGSNTYGSRSYGSNPYGSNSRGSNPYGSTSPHGTYNAPWPAYSAPHNSGNTNVPHGNGGGGHSGGGGGHSGGGGHGGGHR